MKVIPAGQEAKMIKYLRQDDERGRELLLKYCSYPMLGMIRRIVSCPHASSQLLAKSFEKIILDINNYSGKEISFFSWMMQTVRKLSVEHALPLINTMCDSSKPNTCTAFTLIMDKGLSLKQAAQVLGISANQVSLDLRSGLKTFSGKRVIKVKS